MAITSVQPPSLDLGKTAQALHLELFDGSVELGELLLETAVRKITEAL